MSPSCLKVCLYHAEQKHAEVPQASQKSQLGQSHANISSEHCAPLSPKGKRRLIFHRCILSHLQEADNVACLCRSADVTDRYRHVHPLWTESITQPKIWIRFSDSTCNSTKDHSKNQRATMGWGFGFFTSFCFLHLPSTTYLTHRILQEPFPCCPAPKDCTFRKCTRNHAPRAGIFFLCPSFRFKPISHIDLNIKSLSSLQKIKLEETLLITTLKPYCTLQTEPSFQAPCSIWPLQGKMGMWV